MVRVGTWIENVMKDLAHSLQSRESWQQENSTKNIPDKQSWDRRHCQTLQSRFQEVEAQHSRKTLP